MTENTFEKKVKKKYNKPKKIQKLYKEKRRIKKIYTNIKHKTEKIKHNYKIQSELINEFIQKEEKENTQLVIKKNRMKIKNGGRINLSTFWEFKNQMDKDKNKETVTNISNEKGETENTKEGIGMVFQKFYTNLFKTYEIGNTAKQREVEIMEDILYKSIKTIGKNENNPKETISLNEVE